MSVFSTVKKPFYNYTMGLASRSPVEHLMRFDTPEMALGIASTVVPIGMDVYHWANDTWNKEDSLRRQLWGGAAGLGAMAMPFALKPLANSYARKRLTSQAFEEHSKNIGKPLTAGNFSSLPQGFKAKSPGFKDEWYRNIVVKQGADKAGNLTYSAGEDKIDSLVMPMFSTFTPFGG